VATPIRHWRFSRRFYKFYREQIARIGFEPQWRIAESLGGRWSVVERVYRKGELVAARITLLQSLSDELAEATAAHEIMHIVLDREGYPAARGLGPAREVGVEFSSMILDPVVYQRLHESGFDTEMELEAQLQEFLKSLEEVNEEPALNSPDRALCVIICAAKLLEYPPRLRLVLKDVLVTKLPSLAAEATGLVRLVEQVGLDNPEKCRVAMQKARAHLGLEEDIVIRS